MIKIIIGIGLGIFIGIEYTEEIRSIMQMLKHEMPGVNQG